MKFVAVWSSPLQRALRTCQLAGFGSITEIDRDLIEWNYGEYPVAGLGWKRHAQALSC